MIPIYAISTGKIEELDYGQKRQMLSALNKVPFSGKMWLSTLGFVEDEQAYKDHGGPHKAVCSFSKANYAMYKEDLPHLPEYAMFGENLTIEDLDESEVYFGNQYRLGEAIIEVSEIREPCWKIQTKYGIPDLVKRMSASGKTGFYFRVIKEGFVKADDNLELLQLANADTRLSVQELNDIYYNDRKNLERLNYALQNPYLSPHRIEKLEKMRNVALKRHK
ncbi:MOSC domain-containing protein [Staphylococcus pragensis]|uniref:MOSC domain-containing protein n=1 Tax=Staphylococcus pragensis TaxID=1611836 RepID=A0A4Z1BRJ6_9STAP|nr:MOSC domain-containing protein [Staphylococcus pragensis]RTX87831.1 MOSC domain-containing protein [Staphylococcus carnosus]TGN27579.1 MOSC domain-containing protein [Staphylococcus pragensis]GGG91648.1 molybdenum cofactor biosysynthesis protein [Staphylococcus pragensis]